jgi:hypothetical protein
LWSAAPTGVSASEALDLDERIRYQESLERIYAEQQTTSAPASAKGNETPSDSELRAKIEKQLKIGDALEQVWGLRIDRDDLQAEYERIIAHSNDREMLGRLLDALDRDPETVAACLVEPILLRRAIHRAYWWDAGIHAELRQTAMDELLTEDGAGGLEWFSGDHTETEWRLTAGDEPLGMEFENGVQIRRVNREQWARLLEAAEGRWETAGGPRGELPLLRLSPLEETREYFSASVILERGPTHLRLATYTWWKRTFSDWWDEHADEFSPRIVDTGNSITLQATHSSVQPEAMTKTHEVTADTWFSLDSSDPDAPSARDQHTAVWAGSQMIIWGGTNGAQVFRSGGVYDPATDSWTATAQNGDCPTPRIGHTASWRNTGAMFVWGGWNGTDYFADGSKYSPATNTWTAMSNTGAVPAARYGHAAWIGPGDLTIWGGKKAISKTNSGAWYDFSANRWYELPVEPTTPSARDQMIAVVEQGPLIYHLLVWGGSGMSSTLDDGGYWEVNPGQWEAMDPDGAPSPRYGHTGLASGGVCTAEPHVYIWGGFTPYDPPYQTNTGAEFNSFPWGGWIGPTPTGTYVPAGRYDHTAVMDTTKDLMVVWGGTTGSGSTSSGGTLDLCDASWVATDSTDPDCPSARSGHTAVWTGKTMLVWGGNDGSVLGDGGVYTHCWGTPTTSLTPTVADEDSCSASGIRISWGSTPTWNDYDVHRTVVVLRDSAVIASELLPSDGSYLDTTAVEDQSYDYQIRFINSCGGSVTTTSVSGVDRASSTPTVTVAPTAVDADGCASISGIDISWPADPDDWGDDGNGDRKYRVWRWQNSFDGWVAQGAQIDYGITSYHDPNPSLGKYRVKYINGCGGATDSPETPTVLDLAGAAPTVSQTVSGADADACVHTGNRVTWPADPDDWGDGGTGDRVYRVRRSIDGVNFNPIGDNIAYGTTSYLDAGANPDQQYHYQVRYKNGCNLATDSATDTATDVDGEAPVTGFNAAASDPDTCDDGGVNVTWPQDAAFWGDGDSGTRTYEIERSGTIIGTGIPYGTTTYTDISGVNGTPYTYRVRMVNGCGLSALSGLSGSAADLPAAPSITVTNNTATDVDACATTGVIVTWSADPDGGWGDDGSGARTYDVLRDGIAVQTGIAYGTTEFTDTTGTLGTGYVYTVRYVNCGALHSETTGVAAADINGTPATPASPVVTDASACAQDGVWINWAPSSGAATYDLRLDGVTELTGVADPYFYDPGNSSSHTYEVRANGVSCPGDWSQATTLADLMDPNAQFCDGFRSGDTSAWTVTSP